MSHFFDTEQSGGCYALGEKSHTSWGVEICPFQAELPDIEAWINIIPTKASNSIPAVFSG